MAFRKRLDTEHDLDKHLTNAQRLIERTLTITVAILVPMLGAKGYFPDKTAQLNLLPYIAAVVAFALSICAGIYSLIGPSAIYNPIAISKATTEDSLASMQKLIGGQLALFIMGLILLIGAIFW